MTAAARTPGLCATARGSWCARALRPVAARFSSDLAPASTKVAAVIREEIKHEKQEYQQPKDIRKFLQETKAVFKDTEGDVNLCLERELGDKLVRIEWQLSSPFDPEAMGAEDEGEQDDASTDFMVTVESQSSGQGMTFYCSTQAGQDHRYVIGNVKCYADTAERDNVSAYSGPEFEDLDDKVQESLEEYLESVGLGTAMCDFIDAVALDKEQREYIRWLNLVGDFLES